jgi:phospholipase C
MEPTDADGGAQSGNRTLRRRLNSTGRVIEVRYNRKPTRVVIFVIFVIVVIVAAGLFTIIGNHAARHRTSTTASASGIHKIKHIIMIMQENRSFDHYFGTFPGAAGIPMNSSGVPTVCSPNPATGGCDRPFVNHIDTNSGGPHDESAHRADVNGGKMDGFVREAASAERTCAVAENPVCTYGPIDVMGYHTKSDIPNYWSYASNFVLQDHMFAPTSSWSSPQHIQKVSGWAATCKRHNDPSSCRSRLANGFPSPLILAQTDLTYLLHKHGITWRYYVVKGNEPDCEDDQTYSCDPVARSSSTPGLWNPLLYFDTVRNNRQQRNVQSVANFYSAAKNGSLPQVSWVVPSAQVSEHGPWPVSSGQSYVTSLVNAVMNSPNWSSTAIFVSWDDWGGFHDHVKPPVVDRNGYGIRVPGLVISPYAKKGYVDHQILSFDAYLKFVEDVFLGGQRIDPANDGRPDPRPNVRENASILGDLVNDFDFNQAPRSPILLPVHPRTTLTATVPFSPVITAVSPGDKQAVVDWGVPFASGGSPITGYVVTPYLNGVAQTRHIFKSVATTQTITGLATGASYTFVVSAINALGIGYRSSASAAITVGSPGPPRIQTIDKVGSRSLRVAFAAPANNGATITSYTATCTSSNGGATKRKTSPAAPITVTGVTPAKTYQCTIRATNARGAGPASRPSIALIA